MKLIFLNRFFYPDHSATSQMLSDLAFALAGRGWAVHIITSRLRYDNPDARLVALEEREGVTIHRVWSSRFGRKNLVGRMADYLSFYLSAASRLMTLTSRGDIVIAKTDPPLVSVIAAPIVWLKGAKLINWLQDLFPEVAQALGIGRSRLAQPMMNFLRYIRNHSLQSAKMNVVIGGLMSERLAKQNISEHIIQVIPNWANGKQIKPIPAKDNPLRHEWELDGRFVVGYSGNLGRAHEFDTVLDAIKYFSDHDKETNLSFLFIGGGAQQKKLEQTVQEHHFLNVQFRPYQPREHLAQSLSVADIHLISLQPELEGLIVPSKFYGIAAAGRPAIFIGDSQGEISKILRDSKTGQNIEIQEGQVLSDILRHLAQNPDQCEQMGIDARKLFDKAYDIPHAINRWEALLDKVKS